MENFVDILKAGPNMGSLPDPIVGQFLPKEVSNKIIEDIESQVVMRQYCQKIMVPGRYLVIPKISFGGDNLKAYKIDYASASDYKDKAQADFTTGSITVEPKMLVSWTELLEHDLEFATLDLATYIQRQLTRTIARAEEKALVHGTGGAGDSYLKLFVGLAKLTKSLAPVTYADNDDIIDKISLAVKNLGVYADDRSQLVLAVSPTFANRLRKSAKIINVGYYAPAEQSAIRTGTLPKICGMEVVEMPELESENGTGEYAVIFRRDFGLLAQRGNILFRRIPKPEDFKVILVMAEFVDFIWQYVDGDDKALGMVELYIP